jgi:hypothetical protein
LLKSHDTTRRTAPAMFLLMLAFAVFAWGLHYKLSLYRSEATHHRQAAAKLLSQKERPFAGTGMERLLLHAVPIITRRACAATVAALPVTGDPAPFGGHASLVELEANQLAEPFRHLDPFDPRGPPIHCLTVS